MKVSVAVCTHSADRYDDLRDAAESVYAQTYDNTELVLVSDGSDEVYERMVDDYGKCDDAVVGRTEENVGISGARTRAGEIASGDVVAFIDDDAIAREDWIEELVRVYEEKDVIAAGGRMAPRWVAGKPRFLPEEFYWLIGVTHRGFADGEGEVRNTFASNLSFRRDVFLELGGFNTSVGRKGDRQIQAHESEICSRMRREYGKGVYYNPGAVVEHKIFDYRTSARWLVNRSFWQGYSKRVMDILVPEASGDKNGFLKRLLFEFVPERLGSLVRRPSSAKAQQFVMLFILTAFVGFGFVYGLLTVRQGDFETVEPSTASES